MEYMVASSRAWGPETAIRVLEKKVNELIKEGWEPLGGLVTVSFNDSVYQTLIKRD
jgi:hypothetical protein